MTIDGYCTCGVERETLLAPADLLEQMSRAGVDHAVIAPDDRELALDNAAGNARISQIAARSEGRLIAACGVSPWHKPDDSRRLLDQGIGAGARMLVLAPALQGFNPCDELVDPLLETAASTKMPVYVHTGPHSVGGPTQIVMMARRHRCTRFILGHCGSTDYGWDMPTVFGAGLENLWFELSFVRPWTIPAYAKLSDESRLIFASSAPRNDVRFELDQANASWPINEHAATYGGNLAHLLAEVAA